MQKISIKINFIGGIVSTGALLQMLEIAHEAQVTHVRFGLRQQLLADIPVKKFKEFELALTEKKHFVRREKRRLPEYC